MSLEGVLLIDKPKGPSSFDVIKRVRALCRTKKVGHAGTLDPLASGLLVVCLGRFTKLVNYFMENPKTYEAIFTLGMTTSTDDGEGEVLKETPCNHLTQHDISNGLQQFLGRISQIPPSYSAVKINGRRAYEIARADKEVALTARFVQVFDMTLKGIAKPDVTVRIDCSKGTYVRSIARDLGMVLGVGAYAKEIRRIKSGSYRVEDALHFKELTYENLKRNLLVGSSALGGLEEIEVDGADRENIRHGRKIGAKIECLSSHAILVHQREPIAILYRDNSNLRVARVL